MLHNGFMSWYAMNQAMAELHLAANRELFAADPDAYLGRFELTAAERAAIRAKDVLALWDLGAQPYILRAFQRRNGISDEAFNQALAERRYEDRATR
jgi:aromatic-ring opening dioxygenase LigAB LigA subunit